MIDASSLIQLIKIQCRRDSEFRLFCEISLMNIRRDNPTCSRDCNDDQLLALPAHADGTLLAKVLFDKWEEQNEKYPYQTS